MPKEPPSRHLSDRAALDASRGVTSATDEQSVQAHIDVCPACREKVNTWKGFATILRRLPEANPPAEIVGRVKALVPKTPRVSVLTRLKAAVHYDSAVLPLPAGVRGASLPDQVVYQAEEFAVELRVARERSRHLVVVGQISNAAQPEGIADVPVTLRAGNRIAIRARSNVRGEFHLEYDERDRMWIEVAPEEGRMIRIPLRSKPKTS
jgi:anti-sigma factor RsiW